jgi:hypothetical protein
MTANPIELELKTSKDWDAWYATAHAVARNHKIWGLVGNHYMARLEQLRMGLPAELIPQANRHHPEKVTEEEMGPHHQYRRTRSFITESPCGQ